MSLGFIGKKENKTILEIIKKINTK